MLNKIDWIKSQLQPNEIASAVTSRLNTPATIDNPISQPQILTPITLSAIRKVVAGAESFKVQETETWNELVAAIAINDRATCRDLIITLVAGGILSQTTAAKLSGIFAATIPDPNWKKQIIATPASIAGFDAVYVHEAQEAIDRA